MAKKISELEHYSKEVQELMGKVPPWLIANGSVLLLAVLLLLAGGSWFFKYPDIVTAPVVVTGDVAMPASLTGHLNLKRNDGKVKTGQRVNVKFASYPYLTYGTVSGVVSRISPLPTGEGYQLDITFPNQLVSTYGKKIEFLQELSGTAEIITDDQRLLSRILHPVKALFSKKIVE